MRRTAIAVPLASTLLALCVFACTTESTPPSGGQTSQKTAKTEKPSTPPPKAPSNVKPAKPADLASNGTEQPKPEAAPAKPEKVETETPAPVPAPEAPAPTPTEPATNPTPPAPTNPPAPPAEQKDEVKHWIEYWEGTNNPKYKYEMRKGPDGRWARNGYAQAFYANGVMEREGNYKNNVRVGEWKYYDQEGKLLRTEQRGEGAPEAPKA